MTGALTAVLHTATISHHLDQDGHLETRALCTTCDWEGPTRGAAAVAWADGIDHEDGIEVTS